MRSALIESLAEKVVQTAESDVEARLLVVDFSIENQLNLYDLTTLAGKVQERTGWPLLAFSAKAP